MVYVLIALVAIVAAAYFILAKVHAAAALFFVGVLLLMLAALTGNADTTTQEIESSGNAFYDQLLVIESLFTSRFAGTGMAIMVLFGFVAYMRHIGADAKTVVLLSKPLQRFRGSYWMVPIGFALGTLLSLVVPSASALSLLLIATLLPALIAAGLTPLTVGAIVVTASTIVPTPLEAGLIQGAALTDMSVSQFVFSHVARSTIPALVVVAFTHMWWQWRCDRRDARRAEGGRLGTAAIADDAVTDSVDGALQRAAGLPMFYAFLPLLPLLLIVVTATLYRLDVLTWEAEILPVTVVSLMLAVVIESIRHRNVNDAVDGAKHFFVGMGEGAAGVVSLIVAAAILVEGITQMGVIRMLTDSTSHLETGGAVLIVLFVLATAVLAVLTGSGVAPYFAFAETVPALAAESGVLPVRMLTSIWGTSNLMRQVSPVSAAVLIVAGAINVSPLELVKRTSVPMIAGAVANVVLAFLFIHA